MVDLVFLFEAAQDGDRLFNRRLVQHHRLEAPLEGGILFDVLTVFGNGGGTDGSELTACERRFENVGGIHGTF